MTSQQHRLSGLDGAVDVSYLRSCVRIPGAQAAWDHVVWWLGRRVVAATTQVRLLVWSDFDFWCAWVIASHQEPHGHDSSVERQIGAPTVLAPVRSSALRATGHTR